MSITVDDILASYGLVVDPDEIEHAGVKGMKWGVRKGKVTAASSTSSHPSEDAQKASALRAKAKSEGIHSLSNEELRKLIERQNLDQQYAKLNPKQVNKGKKMALEILETQGKQIVGAQFNKYATKGIEAAIAAAISGAAKKK